MKKFTKLYPGGASKAFVISYDDGVEQDVRFVELLNKYGLKGTFNLNSQLSKTQFTWTHECGMEIRRLSEQTIGQLYVGHEVASHTLTHPDLSKLSEEEILFEMVRDKENLQQICNCRVVGFAVPFLYFDERIARCAQKAGFRYARMSVENRRFDLFDDPFFLKPTIFHLDACLNGCIDQFEKSACELALFLMVGHSYDLDVENCWQKIENVFCRISRNPGIASLTTAEAVQYILASKKVVVNGDILFNGSDSALWFNIGGETICLQPNQQISLAD